MSVSEHSPVSAIPGVGKKKEEAYQKLGIQTVRDLLLFAPRSYLDLRSPAALDALLPGESPPVLVRARILSKSGEQRIRKGFSVFHVKAESDGTALLLTFYNAAYTVRALPFDEDVWLYGSVGGTLLHREMKAPRVVPAALVHTLAPIYPATAKLSTRTIAKDITRAIEAFTPPLSSCVPDEAAGELPTLLEAVRLLHRPTESGEALQKAQNRLALEGVFSYCVSMLLLRSLREEKRTEPMENPSAEEFFRSLPYRPTDAQLRAIEDIRHDFASGRVMSRMVQGDVGCGKTVIAAAAVFMAVQSGYQAALMAPTEILSEQHLATFERLFAPFGIRCALLTGSTTAKERKELLRCLADGEISLLIGTHALFQPDVFFSRLGLVVTDEQHRFGVAQRTALSAKGSTVHTLVMSATPIPRTLSLILYSDLDLSVVDQMPAGRKTVATYRIDSAKRQRAFGFIRRHLDAGAQAYIICPLVEDETDGREENHLLSAVRYAKNLSETEFAAYRVGLLHGQMKPKEKEDAMRRFVSGETQLLVATTVVEVGVDVPNAAVMMIENAERFGLSQLHQLRGRVGRGEREAFCILVSDAKGEAAAKRLSAICSTCDGFRIAEEDLRLRGPGDLLGVQQSGFADFAALSDPALFSLGKEAADRVLTGDPDLSSPEHAQLKSEVQKRIGQIGAFPN